MADHKVGIEIKFMTAATTKINASDKARKSNMLLRCVFGDSNFKDTISNKSYRMQVINHALIMGVNKVLFTIAEKIKIIQLLLIDVLYYHLSIYKYILNKFKYCLDFFHEASVPFPKY